MPCYHAGPMTDREFADACRRSSVYGCHAVINSGLEWVCKFYQGGLRGFIAWWRMGRPKTAKEAVEAIALERLP